MDVGRLNERQKLTPVLEEESHKESLISEQPSASCCETVKRSRKLSTISVGRRKKSSMAATGVGEAASRRLFRMDSLRRDCCCFFEKGHHFRSRWGGKEQKSEPAEGEQNEDTTDAAEMSVGGGKVNAVNVIVTTTGGSKLSSHDLVQWVNDTLHTDTISKVQG